MGTAQIPSNEDIIACFINLHFDGREVGTSVRYIRHLRGFQIYRASSMMNVASVHHSQPAEAAVIEAILKQEMKVANFEPRVVAQLLYFSYQYVTDVLHEARVYSETAGKSMIDSDDVKLALHFKASNSLCCLPSKEVIQEIAKEKNTVPLPPIREHAGLRLPPDRFCMLQPNFRLRKLETASPSHVLPLEDTRVPESQPRGGSLSGNALPTSAAAGLCVFPSRNAGTFGGFEISDDRRKRKRDADVDEDYDDY